MPNSEAGRSRVLVIEDNKADQAVLRRTLAAYDLTFVESGEAGLELLGAELFDLVLLV